MRPFTDFLRDHRNGKLVAELTERLARVGAAVEETGKPGSLTLKIEFKPSKGDEGAFKFTPKISTNIPERDLPDALFFRDEDGSFVRESPTQRGIFDATPETDLGDAPRRLRRGED